MAVSDYGYDQHGRLISIGHTGVAPGSTFAESHGYTYDGANRVASYSNVLDGVFAQYGYDDRGQLTSADHTGTPNDETYDYDDNGNRETANGQSYQTTANNRILSDDTYTYEYDNEGNLIFRWETNDPGQRTYYTWDHRNRLVHVSQLDGDHEVLVADYVYDAFNQLVYRRTNRPFEDVERTTVFVYDNGQVALQFDKAESATTTAGDLSHRYLWGPAVDQLLADEQVESLTTTEDNETLWALADHLGSVRDVVDSNGELRIHRRFDAFGNIVGETHYNASGAQVTAGQAGYVDVAFAFTGRLVDKATGLQNNLHRWYDPHTGRWISEDPIGFEAGDANLYRYVGNMPTTYVDPSGLAWYWPWGADEEVEEKLQEHRERLAEYLEPQGSNRTRAGADGMRRGAFGAPDGRNTCDTFQQGRQMAGQLLRDTAQDAAIEVATLGVGGLFSKADDVADLARAAQRARRGAKGILAGGRGFNSFDALKSFLGPAGKNREWHHIVEQSKIGQFTCEQIHNTNNVVSLPAGFHDKISAFYSSKPDFAGGVRVRDWLAGKSLQEQWEFGMRQIERFTRK